MLGGFIGILILMGLWHWIKQLHPSWEKISTTKFIYIFPFAHFSTLIFLMLATSIYWLGIMAIVAAAILIIGGIASENFRNKIVMPMIPFTLPAIIIVIIMSHWPY